MAHSGTFLFLTSCPIVWGGSEELWAGAAVRLHERGFRIRTGRSEPWPRGRLHPRWNALKQSGVGVNNFGVSGLERAIPDAFKRFVPLLEHPAWRTRNLVLAAKIRLLAPDLAVISQGQAYDGCFPICLPEVCRFAGVPYVLICQKAAEIHWPDDRLRPLLQRCYRDAARVFFVSEHNRRTTQLQIGVDLSGAEVVRNPFMVKVAGPLPWPSTGSGPLRLACVARMWPLEKGQDILLAVLAREKWRTRPVEVSFYGDGPMAQGLEEMAAAMGCKNVRFPGFADPTEIWRTHHALVLPSRAEGLPLAQVEAMMCGRPVIVAEAGGTAEIIQDGEHGFLATAATEVAIDDALERAWQRRDDWPAIGDAAAAHVRAIYPTDPCGTFADRLQAVRHVVREAS
jgi:glycosyltransferase involved in cell wall biosynthesis